MNRRREDGKSDTCTYHHARITMLGSPRNIFGHLVVSEGLFFQATSSLEDHRAGTPNSILFGSIYE